MNNKSFKKPYAACGVRKNAGFKVRSGEKESFRKTQVIRRAINSYRDGVLKLSDVEEFIKKEMDSLNFSFERTRQLQTKEAIDVTIRYLSADNRRKSPTIERLVSFEGEKISVLPDFMYLDEREIEGEKFPVVEVGDYTTGSSDITSKIPANKEFYGMRYNLECLGLLLYGIDVLAGKKGIVRIVIDALKTDSDKGGDYSAPFKVAKRDNGSIKASDNRRWFEVGIDESGNVCKDDVFAKINAHNEGLFNNYKETLKFLNAGVSKEDLPKGSCDACELSEICNYHSSPVHKDTSEKVSGGNGSIVISKEQQAVINYDEGICVVCAGAGTGKTHTMATRIARLLMNGVKPEEIIVLSFSEAAVSEIIERTASVVNDDYEIPVDCSKIKTSTFNGFGNEVIQKNYRYFGFTGKPTLIDEVENYELIMRSVEEGPVIEGFDYKNPHMNFKNAKGVVKALEGEFSTIRNDGLSKDEYLARFEDVSIAENIWKCYEIYVRLLKESNHIDYADQSRLVLEAIENGDEDIVLDNYRYKHIIVDEFQDSNDFQLDLIKLLMCTSEFRSLMVVGDDSQAIYGWRGATPENIIELEKKLGMSVDDLALTVNYRSTKEIVDLGNEVISHNLHKIMKTITSARGASGKKPGLYGFKDKAEELAFVADKIAELISDGVSPDEIAVIAHNRGTLAQAGGLLSERGVMSQFDMKEYIMSDSKTVAVMGLAEYFADKSDTKGFAEYFNCLNGNSLLAMGGSAGRFLNESMEAFNNIIEGLSSDKEVYDYLMLCFKTLDDGKDNLFKTFLKKLEAKNFKTSAELVSYMSKIREYGLDFTALKEGKFNAVSLVTAHSSKGREWKYVFGVLSDFDFEKSDDLDELRRLVYVLSTRAKDELNLVTIKEHKSGKYMIPDRMYQFIAGLNSVDVEEALKEQVS